MESPTTELEAHMHTSFDRALRRALRLSADDERAFEQQRAGLSNREHALYDMSIIDAKSSSLLTHVSIMLAVVAVLLAQPNTYWWQLIFTVELIAFSVIGVMLLRCVDVLGPPFRRLPDEGEDLSEYYRGEILLRRGVFQLMLRAVRVLTVVLIVVVGLKNLP
jgi:hypothetical protein